VLHASATLFGARHNYAWVPTPGALLPTTGWQRVQYTVAQTLLKLTQGFVPSAMRTRIQHALHTGLPWQALQPLAQNSYPIPLPSQSVAVVWSPLGLDGMANPRAILAEWFRVLKPGGCLFFSAMGPDTARVLHAPAKQLGSPMADFLDMHDWGDTLAQVGFADPVMEMERLNLHYASPQALLADWRAWCGNPLQTRRKSLVGQEAWRTALATLEQQRQADGRIHLPLELLYGHAWKIQHPQPGRSGKANGGEVRIAVADIGGRGGRRFSQNF
jgi:malonyl-CoA O-methyltransferase